MGYRSKSREGNLDSARVEKLWRDYKENRDQKAREELIVHYTSLVKYAAGQMAMGMPREVRPEDLETYGVFGLIDAMDRFDPQRRIKFETYAISRIKGAILDGIRKMDWVPASVRRKVRAIEDAYRDFYVEYGRNASDEELAGELGITVERLREDLSQMSRSALIYLDHSPPADNDDRENSLLATIPDRDVRDPFETAQWNSQKRRLGEAIEDLKEKERLVITLYYYEGLTLTEIAGVLDLSPSRISQIHSKAVMRLRGRLAGDRDLFG